ncbi:MAG: DUF6492 family protein [Pseudomonadota bacterium]
MDVPNNELAIITCSYAPDFERCQRLCRSVDQWVDREIAHRLIVPSRDLQLFRPLEDGRRTVVCVEDVVPGPYWQLPSTNRWWLDQYGWPVRGWVMQQVTKLSANNASCAENLLFADSDLIFIRPFNRDSVIRDHQLRLHRIPGAMDSGLHLRWHLKAANLLGEKPTYFGSDYVGQLITWKRSQLEGLQAHLESVHHKPWHRSVARSLRISEYILYGAYIDAVVGLEKSGHYACSDDLCHCCWFWEDARALSSQQSKVRPDAFALLLQSNLGLSHAEEQKLLTQFVRSPTRLVEAI